MPFRTVCFVIFSSDNQCPIVHVHSKTVEHACVSNTNQLIPIMAQLFCWLLSFSFIMINLLQNSVDLLVLGLEMSVNVL